jgi:hypothetical protein
MDAHGLSCDVGRVTLRNIYDISQNDIYRGTDLSLTYYILFDEDQYPHTHARYY